MKNIYKVFAAAALLSIAACTPKADYVTYDFVNVPATAVTNEDVVLEIPVQTVAQSGVGSEGAEVQFKVIEVKGANGVDYTVEPANGIVSTTMDTPGKIVVKPTNKVGEYTGDYKLAIELTGVSGDFSIGGSYQTSITIKDIDHPLSEILGTYAVQHVYFYDGSLYYGRFDMELKPVDGNINQVACTGINMFAADYNNAAGDFDVIGDVSEDMKTITFVCPQAVRFSTGYGTLELYHTEYKGGYMVYDDNIIYTATATGYQSEQGAGFVDEYVWPSYGGFGVGTITHQLGVTTWTKK